MSGSGITRRRRDRAAWGGRRSWRDTLLFRNRDPSRGRYVHIPKIDSWHAVPFDMLPAPQRDAVLERVGQLTASLDGAIDEGTGASLDPLIESWTGAWIATVESEYVDHCHVIGVHRGQARQWLTEASVKAEHEREKLDHFRSDYLASRNRLTGELPDRGLSGPPVGATGLQALDSGEGPDSARDARQGSWPAPRQDWAEPHLVAGRSMGGLILLALLILVGAMADTIAFHNVLELVLSTEKEWLAWVMAVGTTSMALVAAGTLGVARAVRRRGRHWAPRHRPSRLPLVLSATVWLGLGLAMFLIRWRGNANIGGLNFTPTIPAPHQPFLLQAIFFAAIYLISGACTMIEAERLYNPEYFAFRRLRKLYSRQAKRVARAEAAKDRAEAALELHDGQLQREDQRRIAAISDRKALAAEAANYARVRMASMETGPIPELPAPPGAGPAAAGAHAGGQPSGGGAGAP